MRRLRIDGLGRFALVSIGQGKGWEKWMQGKP
jgi:hypothetical protein